jgi:para-nitrobenzyl esterase
LPVYVYIHGGCFTSGAGSDTDFDGFNLSKKGMVVVTINYRLGGFGFFGIDSTEANDYDATGVAHKTNGN